MYKWFTYDVPVTWRQGFHRWPFSFGPVILCRPAVPIAQEAGIFGETCLLTEQNVYHFEVDAYLPSMYQILYPLQTVLIFAYSSLIRTEYSTGTAKHTCCRCVTTHTLNCSW